MDPKYIGCIYSTNFNIYMVYWFIANWKMSKKTKKRLIQEFRILRLGIYIFFIITKIYKIFMIFDLFLGI